MTISYAPNMACFTAQCMFYYYIISLTDNVEHLLLYLSLQIWRDHCILRTNNCFVIISVRVIVNKRSTFATELLHHNYMGSAFLLVIEKLGTTSLKYGDIGRFP